MKGIPLRTLRECPAENITLISSHPMWGHCTWHFGPNTINVWPKGDFKKDGKYIEPAFDEYDAIRVGMLTGEYEKYLELNPTLELDEGL